MSDTKPESDAHKSKATEAGTLMDVGKDVAAVIQALAILRAIGSLQEPPVLTAISRAAGVSRSTTLNILRTLVNERVITFSPEAKAYRLGMGLLELSRPLLNRSEVELIEPDLRRVAGRYETTGSIWLVSDDDRLILLGRIVPDSHIRIEFRIATRLPAYAGATGTVVAAARGIPTDAVERAIAAIRWAKEPTLDEYLAEIARWKSHGYSFDVGHLIRGVTSVASPITDRQGRPRLVVAAHAFLGQMEPEVLQDLGGELSELARRAGAALYQAGGAPAETHGGAEKA